MVRRRWFGSRQLEPLRRDGRHVILLTYAATVASAATGALGCGRIAFAPVDPDTDGSVVDAPIEYPTGPWGPPTRLNLAGCQDDASMTADGLELFCNNDTNVYVSKRSSPDVPWPAPTQIASIAGFYSPEISADGLTLWGTSIATDIVYVTRPDRASPFGSHNVVAELSSPATDDGPSVSPDGLTVVFDSLRVTGRRLYISTRATMADAFEVPQWIMLTGVSGALARPFLRADGLELVFEASLDLYRAVRPSTAAAFETATLLGELAAGEDSDPWMSIDGHVLLFTRDDAIWEARR